MGCPYIPAAVAIPILLITACAPPGPRPYYSREAGTWITSSIEKKSYTTTPPEGIAEAGPSGSESGVRKVAESYLGVPYRWGGQSRDGMDCSGFVRQVFKEALSVQLPHNASAISNFGRDVSKDDLQPNDLVFFKGILFIEHTGIYMGNGYFIHSQSNVGVNYTRLDAPYFGEHYAGAKRVVQ